MKLAAIDIGSNAARLQISSVLNASGTEKLKRIEYLRFPLQLGFDVLQNQQVSPEGEKKLTKLLQAFKLLMELYQVDHYMACATSALREAHNQEEVVERIQQTVGLKLDVIDGEREAILIHKAIRPLLEDRYYVHIDVGGGSTEVSFYQGLTRIDSRSFRLGAIKLLVQGKAPLAWEEMKSWMLAQSQQLQSTPVGVATGGNIRKVAQLVRKNVKKPISIKELRDVCDYLTSCTVQERISTLELNPDRAEVIAPAVQIYHAAMRWGGVKKILIPDVSLRDGITQALYEQYAMDV